MPSLPTSPTDAELIVLQALWRLGQPSTLKQVHAEITSEIGYTSVQKFLQIMEQKGLVRKKAKWPALYEAVFSELQTQRHLLRDLVKKVYGGSMERMVMQALASDKTRKGEFADIKRLIDSHKKA